MKIAICDDEKICLSKLEKLLLRYKSENNLDIQIDSYLIGNDLLKSNLIEYDLIFLDVEMIGDNGIEIARKIRIENKEVFIVYVSGLIQYAPSGYEVNARAYILKNDLDALLKPTMDTIIKELTLKDDAFKFKFNNVLTEIPLKNILFIESFNKTVDIHTIDYHINYYEIREKISDIEESLKNKGFLRIHKSYLVNMNNILKLKNYKALLKNGKELNVSQRKWSVIYSKYIDWRGRI